MVSPKEKMKKEVDDLRDELKAVKKVGLVHVHVTQELRKRVTELEAEVKRLKKKV